MPKKRPGPGKTKRGFRISRGVWVGLAILALVAAGVVSIVYGMWASTFDLKQVDNIPERSAVFDMDGKFYARLAGENRVVVHLDAVSDFFVKALLAREDSRFFSHHGIDPIGIARAHVAEPRARAHPARAAARLRSNWRSIPSWAASTCGACNRKLLEAFLAIRIEQNFTKKQILEAYMNRIYFGAGSVRHRDRQPGLFRQAREGPDAQPGRDAGRAHPQPRPLLALQTPAPRADASATRCWTAWSS